MRLLPIELDSFFIDNKKGLPLGSPFLFLETQINSKKPESR